MVTAGPPVVIVGARVGGLTLALLLRRRGIRAEVLSCDDVGRISVELRDVGTLVHQFSTVRAVSLTSWSPRPERGSGHG